MDKNSSMVVALIPARGGSKGIPKKNIKLLNGIPLIAHSIEVAKKCTEINRIIVSTDSEEIALVARSFGAEVPFVRPAELSADDAPGIGPVLHCLEMMPEIKTLLLLQPTSPLRSASDITSCIKIYRDTGCGVVSIAKVAKHPAWMYRMGDAGKLSKYIELDASRRQDLEDLYCLNGALYLAGREQLLRDKSFITGSTQGFEMPVERSVDLDSQFDWDFAEFLIANTGVVENY